VSKEPHGEKGTQQMTKLAGFDLERPLPPPWMMYPHISYASIGWRMGYGEGYSYDFDEWFGQLAHAEQVHYAARFPSPITWPDFYRDEPDYAELHNRWQNGVLLWDVAGEPRYTREKLAEATGKLEDAVFFWKPGNSPKDCFSQWQPSAFTVDTDHYSWAEQHMMAEKARVFQDKEMRGQILSAGDPREIKALGRKVSGFSSEVWDAVKHAIVLNGNYAKFAQNADMRDSLLQTGDKVLVEASPLDVTWGIGLSANNPHACVPAKWRGKNLLGFALMEVRDEIRRVYRHYDTVNWDALPDYDG
jgi:ribA/ribD-fused uncharacterized protein